MSSCSRSSNRIFVVVFLGICCSWDPRVLAFTTTTTTRGIIGGQRGWRTAQQEEERSSTSTDRRKSFSLAMGIGNSNENNSIPKMAANVALGLTVAMSSLFLGPTTTTTTTTTSPFFMPVAVAAEATTTTEKQYDGFAEYAKENQMAQSDVGCFINKCGQETKALFSNPRGIKGVSCLGRCKGEQSCATRCFAEFGSEDLNNWLSCTIEDNECVKVPKELDNSAENVGYATSVRNFDPKSLLGTWYKTNGLNPNYDLFDCQSNTFTAKTPDAREVDMDIFFRVARPESSGGGYWENQLVEHMVIDDPQSERTMHTEGKMYGLTFDENWFIIGESDGVTKKDTNNVPVPPYKLVAYKGHTLQGNYEGAFVYAKEPIVPEAAIPYIKEDAAKAGLDFNKFTQIDNTCPTGNSLNDATAGTGTSTTDWLNLVVGEGGVIDWISPGWRGEYKK